MAMLLYVTRRAIEAFADEMGLYLASMVALCDLRCCGAARDMLALGAERFADEPELRIAEANILASEQRLHESLSAWERLRHDHPDAAWAWIGHAEALQRLDRFAAADATLCAAASTFADDDGVAWHWAFNPHYTGDWSEAGRRWDIYRRKWPQDCAGLVGRIAAYRSAGDYQAAQTTIDRDGAVFRDEPLFKAERAKLAGAQENWPEAVALWEALAREQTGDDDVLSELAKARMQLSLHQAQDGADEGPAAASNDLAARFESLGVDCEFGLFQRALGHEPLGLLRWSATSVPELVRAFRNRFAGLGDVENIELVVVDSELYLRDLAYDMSMHTFIAHEPGAEARLKEKMSQRLRFLIRRLLEQLEGQDRIFILKDNPASNEFTILRLFEEMRSIAECRLVVVQREDAQAPAFSFKQLRPGLHVARIDRFGNDGGGWDVPVASWLALCQAAAHAP